MSTDEFQELHEHAEHAHHNPSLAPVSLTMAVLAVFVAVASLLGHRAHTQEVILQAESSGPWAYYPAQKICQHEDDFFTHLTARIPGQNRQSNAQICRKDWQAAQ